MVGNTAVGKSCLVSQFEQGRINQEHDTTIGVEFASKFCTLNNDSIKIQIWDTAGQENFRSLIRSYYRSAIGAFVVYDISRKQSFYDLKKWIEEITDNGNANVVIIACGNKCDLEEEREVSTEEAQSFANEHNILFIETSAKQGINVQEAFMKVANIVHNKIQDGTITLGKHELGVKTGSQFKGKQLDKDESIELGKEKKTDQQDKGNCC